MGGRGSGSSGVSIGQSVTARHSAYGSVRGTVSHVNSDGTFALKNPRASNGKIVSRGAVFQPGSVQS